MEQAATGEAIRERAKPVRNWWKIGFFAMLLAFEFTRELLVLEANKPADIYTLARVISWDGYVGAEGRWWRSDGGSEIVPGIIKIECRRETGECIEISASTYDGGLSTPTVDRFDADFSVSGVSYENANPDCARYFVRIDTKLDTAIATRIRQENPKNEICAKMEPRVEMKLGDGYKPGVDLLKGHFVPLLAAIVALFKVF